MWGVIIAWAAVTVTGIVLLWRYKATPGEPAEAPRRWPAASSIRLSPDRPTLVMLAHPHCPCTRASLDELAALMTHFHDRVDAYVLFLKPAGVAEDWDKTGLWDRARGITGLTALRDEGGVEAELFGAKVSGQTLLYDPGGELLFSGGITGSRGHVGDNAGLRRVESLISSRAADRATSPVYGCPLHDPDPHLAQGGR